MQEYLNYYIYRIDPLATADDVEEITEINEWDLLIVFKNGRKVLFDRFTGYYQNVFYDNINEITEEQEKKEFAYRLRSLMRRSRITQDDLADMLDITRTTISNYIRGASIPSVITARKIAKALNCSLDDFFYKDY